MHGCEFGYRGPGIALGQSIGNEPLQSAPEPRTMRFRYNAHTAAQWPDPVAVQWKSVYHRMAFDSDLCLLDGLAFRCHRRNHQLGRRRRESPKHYSWLRSDGGCADGTAM